VLRWRDRRGAYHRTVVRNATTRTGAKDRLTERANLARASADAAPVRTFDDAAKHWLKSLEEGETRESTRLEYRRAWRDHLSPAIGQLNIATAKRVHLVDALDTLTRKDGKPLRGRQPHQVLHAVLEYAVDRGWRDANPLAGRRRKRTRKPEPRALTKSEWTKLLELVEAKSSGHQRRNRDLFELLVVLRHTGVRIGEALGLQWGDLVLEANPPRVTISRTLLPAREGVPSHVGPTKSGKVLRIALADEVVDMLADRRERTRRKRKADFVFATDPAGRPMSAANARRRLREATKDTDLAWVHPHSLRHTLATEAAAAYGEAAAADLLGHSDSAVTRRHYIADSEDILLDPRALTSGGRDERPEAGWGGETRE